MDTAEEVAEHGASWGCAMKYAVWFVRLVFAAWMIPAGLNHFVPLFPQPIGTQPLSQELFLALFDSHLFDLVKHSLNGGTHPHDVHEILLYQHHQNGATWVANTLTSESITGNAQTFSVLSAGTTVDAAGGVNVSLVNVDLVNSRTVDITLDSDWASYGVSSAQVITGAEKDTYNDFGQPEAVNIQPLDAAAFQACGKRLSVTLPAKSVAMFRLDRR